MFIICGLLFALAFFMFVVSAVYFSHRHPNEKEPPLPFIGSIFAAAACFVAMILGFFSEFTYALIVVGIGLFIYLALLVGYSANEHFKKV